MNLHVHEITELNWPFDGSGPYFSAIDGNHTRGEKVDPFPAYAHDLALVTSELERTSRLFPLDIQVHVYVSSFEDIARTNAHASPGYDYNAELVDGEYPIGTGTIVLSGKRIPLHPAMTRYLVSHEYGHLVEYRLKKAKLLDMDAYAELRGVTDKPGAYGGRTWHKTIGEIFANDFRILVARREAEFWPHECASPRSLPQLVEWWKQTRRSFGEVLKESKKG